MLKSIGASLFISLLVIATPYAAEWRQFRGSGGLGIGEGDQIPMTWSDAENLKWRVPLPGPGSSSPIVAGDCVFVTCYLGITKETGEPNVKQLQRHLFCVSRESGEVLWSKSLAAAQPEDPFEGFISEHGYASSTPATDGKHVYVFFGKAGVLAYDFEGKELWRTSVGTGSGRMRWGSAASPILYEDLVIVNAGDESRAMHALNKQTGEEVWKFEEPGLESCWSTPLLVNVARQRQELVVAIPGKMIGLDPNSGQLLWHAGANLDNDICTSLIADRRIIYCVGGRRGASLAVRAGGRGDVTDTHVLWTARNSSYVPSPVYYDGQIYWVSEKGLAYCVDATTGKTIYRKRLANAVRGRLSLYASAVLVGDTLLAVSRNSGTFVLAAKPEFQQLNQNVFASDESDFNGSPAVSDNQLLLRSNRFLYCIEVAE